MRIIRDIFDLSIQAQKHLFKEVQIYKFNKSINALSSFEHSLVLPFN